MPQVENPRIWASDNVYVALNQFSVEFDVFIAPALDPGVKSPHEEKVRAVHARHTKAKCPPESRLPREHKLVSPVRCLFPFTTIHYGRVVETEHYGIVDSRCWHSVQATSV